MQNNSGFIKIVKTNKQPQQKPQRDGKKSWTRTDKRTQES